MLRRGLESSGFTVELVDSPDDVAARPDDAALIIDAAATTFADALAAGRFRGRTVLVLGRLDGAVCIPEDSAADVVVEHLREGGTAPDGPAPIGAGTLVHAGGLDAVVDQIERLAAVDLPVLVTGESGVGKDLVARALHERGPRHGRPLVFLAVAATAGELLESELFGHVRGAFTDAVADRVGRLEAAADGTLVLDEIADVPLALQSTFLRVLQDRRFSRVGASDERNFRARVVATTQRDLGQAVQAGAFREDLFHRLAGAVVAIPPLRNRPEDLPVLARHLLARRDPDLRLSEAGMERLLTHSWPGNVRELDHVLQRAALLAEGPEIDLVPIETTLAAAAGADPDAAFAVELERWAAHGRARGESWPLLRQRLDELLRTLRDADEG